MAQVFEVGGTVRDALMGVPSDDVDFVCVAESFDAMLAHITAMGLDPVPRCIDRQHVTIKAIVPKTHPLRKRCKSADFVLSRKDGPSSDGRHPDFVEPGTLADDLARRDFTINAIAQAEDGSLVDPHGGQADIHRRVIRFVGDPMQRIREDGLRVLRAFRFAVTKGCTLAPETDAAIRSPLAIEMLRGIPTERIGAEVRKMFDHDTLAALAIVATMSDEMRAAIFRAPLRLTATSAKVRKSD